MIHCSQRRKGDSNPRNPFGVYSLSRRASSTTPAFLQIAGAKIETFAQIRNNYLGRLKATDISRICSSLIPSGSKPIDFAAI